MSVASVSSTTSTTATSTSKSSSSTSSTDGTYTQFLTLLMKQLEVQDPTNPVDTTEFTSQLVQLSSLEQEMANGDKLDELTSAVQQIGTGATALGYIGRTVEVNGSDAALQDGEATWNYDLDGTAKTVALTVQDADGNVVYRGTGETASGSHSFTWDGKGSNGTTYSSGTYTLSVDAVDSSNATVGTTVTSTGKVTGVDTSSGSTDLTIGDLTVSADDVLSISA